MRETSKIRFDALMALSLHYRERRAERRVIEWRVSTTLWIGMAGATLILKSVPDNIIIPCLVGTCVLHTVFWVRYTYVRNEEDGNASKYFAACAEHILFPQQKPPKPKELKLIHKLIFFMKDGAPAFEALATWALAGAILLFKTYSQDTSTFDFLFKTSH